MRKVSPLFGVLSTLDVFANPSLLEETRKDVFNDELPTHVVDTCCAFDTGRWETGVQPIGEGFIIVEQYADRSEAEAGHKKWVKSLTDSPTQELHEIGVWDL